MWYPVWYPIKILTWTWRARPSLQWAAGASCHICQSICHSAVWAVSLLAPELRPAFINDSYKISTIKRNFKYYNSWPYFSFHVIFLMIICWQQASFHHFTNISSVYDYDEIVVSTLWNQEFYISTNECHRPPLRKAYQRRRRPLLYLAW